MTKPNNCSNDRRLFHPFQLCRPPPSLLRRVLPKIDALAEPVIVIAARVKLITVHQLFGRLSRGAMITDNGAIVVVKTGPVGFTGFFNQSLPSCLLASQRSVIHR